MRQITVREKAFLSTGALVAVALFVWFVLLPFLRGGESGPGSSMEEMQAKLEAFEKLGTMGQPLIALEEEMKSQSGYEEISFRSGTANSVIISIINNFLSDAARQADIKNLENLDTKVETRRTKTETVSSKAVLNSVIDRLYLQQVVADLERIDTMEAEEVDRVAASSFDEDAADDNEENIDTSSDAPDENADADKNTEQIAEDDFDPDQLPPPMLKELERRGISVEQLGNDPDLRKKLKAEFDANVQRTGDNLPPAALEILKERGISVEQFMMDKKLQNELKKEIEARSGRGGGDNPSDDDENDQTEEPADSEASGNESENESEESEESEDKLPDAPEDVEQTETKRPIFPLVPSDIPGKVRDSLGRAMEERQGKSLLNNNIDEIINDAGFADEGDRGRIEGRLKLYNNSVKKKKKEIAGWFNTLGVLDAGKTSQKTSRFSVKMIFKGQIQQLVNFLYNLENSARWLKIESIRISIADKKQTLLGVEINMTATALRGI